METFHGHSDFANVLRKGCTGIATQRLKSDDRIAFPFGCSAEGNYDRFCSDGTVRTPAVHAPRATKLIVPNERTPELPIKT